MPEFEGEYIRANGIDIYCHDIGSGHPLLLIHGSETCSEAWFSLAPVAPVLAERFRVLVPDMRGHGRTIDPVGDLSLRTLANDLVTICGVVGADKPLVCGYSLGGAVAVRMALDCPGFAAAYVFGACPDMDPESRDVHKARNGFRSDGTVDHDAYAKASEWEVAYIKEYFEPYQGTSYWKTYVDRVAASADWFDLRPSEQDLGAIAEPSLVLVGDRDKGIQPVEKAIALYRGLPNGELAVVPSAGHTWPFERPELFAELVIGFADLHLAPPDRQCLSQSQSRSTREENREKQT